MSQSSKKRNFCMRYVSVVIKTVSEIVLAEVSFDESDLRELDDSDDLSDNILDPK